MIHCMGIELSEMQMGLICGGTPNAGQNIKIAPIMAKISLKMNISIVIVLDTIINAPLTINVNQGL